MKIVIEQVLSTIDNSKVLWFRPLALIGVHAMSQNIRLSIDMIKYKFSKPLIHHCKPEEVTCYILYLIRKYNQITFPQAKKILQKNDPALRISETAWYESTNFLVKINMIQTSISKSPARGRPRKVYKLSQTISEKNRLDTQVMANLWVNRYSAFRNPV